MAANLSHQPVLLQEALRALKIKLSGIYLDATFGRGGHARAILDQLNERGKLFALDRDPAAEHSARAQFAAEPRLYFERANFAELTRFAARHDLLGRVDGLLLDLGVSSPQLEDPARGFSFLHDGPLDMRMDPSTGLSAREWLAAVSENDLYQTLKTLGEERFARRIAKAIISARRHAALTRTGQLAALIAAAVPTREPGKHPATRSFQALRMAINDELAALETALAQTPAVLAPDGRLVVISFHSLEDRIVKRFLRRQAHGAQLPDLPVRAVPDATLRLVQRTFPSAAEIQHNQRARSAVMRVAERLS